MDKSHNQMTEEYEVLNPECLQLLFSIERYCGVTVGGGRVFESGKRKEIVDVRHIFSFIAITYLEYTHKQVREWFGMKYDSNVNYARKHIAGLIENNVAYRNRVYNIAVDNGIMGLIFDVIELVEKDNNRIKF